MHILNSTKLAMEVQRNSKILKIEPFLEALTWPLTGMSRDGRKRLSGSDKQSLLTQVTHVMHPALLGNRLDDMNRNMIRNLEISIEGLNEFAHNTVDLYSWCRHTVTVASTDAIYGSLNPFKSNEVEDAFWEFESSLTTLLPNILPQLTARKAYRAREKLVTSFESYYKSNGQDGASYMTQSRWKIRKEEGQTTEDIARLESGSEIAILSNTVPSSFWMLFDIYSRPELLALLREEITQNALTIEDNGRNIYNKLDLARLRDQCPNLISTFQEVLRLRTDGAGTRFVEKDITLDKQYLLKKGSIIQIPTRSIHHETSSWSKPGNFKYDRFITAKTQSSGRVSRFLSFGMAPNICPGRHFASGEIVALTAMILLRYEIMPEAGRWIEPELNLRGVATVTTPKQKTVVNFIERDAFEEAKWEFIVTEGKGLFNLETR